MIQAITYRVSCYLNFDRQTLQFQFRKLFSNNSSDVLFKRRAHTSEILCSNRVPYTREYKRGSSNLLRDLLRVLIIKNLNTRPPNSNTRPPLQYKLSGSYTRGSSNREGPYIRARTVYYKIFSCLK